VIRNRTERRRSAEPEDAMVFVRLLDEQQPDKYEI
jgi:hypothetical protein